MQTRIKQTRPVNHWSKFIIMGLIGLALSSCHEGLNLEDIHPEEDNTNQQQPDPNTNNSPVIRLKNLALNKTTSCNETNDYLAQVFTENLLQQYSYYRGCANCEVTALPASDTATAGGGASAPNAQEDSKAPDNVSGTNNQEQGVNESDILKTDSQGNLYVINDNWFVIVDAFPAENMSATAQLDLGSYASALFFSESEQLAFVITYVESKIILQDTGVKTAAIFAPEYYLPQFELIVIDVADKSSPVIKHRQILDGSYINSRRIENRMHIVSQFDVQIPEALRNNDLVLAIQKQFYDTSTTDAQKDTLRQDLRSIIKTYLLTIDINTLLPMSYVDNNGQREIQPLLACDALYHPDVTITYPHLLMVTSLNLDGTQLASNAIIANGYLTYASQNNLYISQPSWGWWWSGINEQQTVIHQFSIGDNQPVYQATGVIPGMVKDSFSFSEHNGNLRVTSTESIFNNVDGRTTTSNRLQILQNDNAGELATIGKVEGFANGETIFSNRFIGDRAFVVTFRRTDPLFSFDLSDPANPKLMGELEIPGFSDYMQPIDDNHLLTIGMNGDANGAGNHVQLQIFDITQLDNPVLLHKYVPFEGKSGYSWSPANYNHLAFNYFAPGKVLAIPFSHNDWDTNDFFNGILSFNIDIMNGIAPVSKVDHSDFVDPVTVCAFEDKVSAPSVEPQAGVSVDACIAEEYFWYPVQPTRTAIMKDADNLFLYSLSRAGIKATTLDENSQLLSKIELPHR